MAKHSGDTGAGPTSTITVLSVSSSDDDHSELREMLRSLEPQPGTKWLLNTATTLETAVATLQKDSIAIVICESNLLPGSWKDLLPHVAVHPRPPLMIVTSRLADEYLWVDALHHGVYDVLRKPFDHSELSRVITMAALNWRHRHNFR
jgi:DNA-binding response OmpR family regulator